MAAAMNLGSAARGAQMAPMARPWWKMWLDAPWVFLRHCAVTLLAVNAPVAWADATVYAAASLKSALDEIRLSWSAPHAGKVVLVYAGSSALARQIERGAPADIFISADLGWMDYLAQRNLLRNGSRVDLLRNELVMIAPAASKVSVGQLRGMPLAQLLGDDRLSMANPDHVPAGKYGKAALVSLGLWAQVSGKLVRAENVRAALIFVARGEAPLGIVYRTDAAADARVRAVAAFPADAHPPIVYPAALLAGRPNAEASQFLTYLQSAAAAGIFNKHGFLTY